jgi:lipopolysaccharide/colanic/teichoic acid biosynthesis glycosyltransferase
MYLVIKRYLDILFSILVLILLSPVYLLTAISSNWSPQAR